MEIVYLDLYDLPGGNWFVKQELVDACDGVQEVFNL
jgi:hypothetical protein